ncbi:maleylpyruvate isomerase N-terminal domain-containing protein [Acidimicrobiales bacterium]|nr:maleylpyruvate isomerase N-terminal domain-containing protein [Acidimicrobiales bacterium]
MDSVRTRNMVIDAATVAAALVTSAPVRNRWDDPSSLAGMTVGALAAHLVRATGATLAYLDRTDVNTEPEGELLTPVSYFHAAVDSPIHDRIKEVSADEATAGPDQVGSKAGEVAALLAERLPAEPEDRLVGALENRMLTLDDFCRTRMIEIGMHIDDLAHSVDMPTPELHPDVTAEIIDIVMGIARAQHGDWPIIHALARSERSSDEPFPVF